MNPEEKENFIRQKAKEHIPEINEKISWSLHALKKLRVEGLRKKEVEDFLNNSIIIEDYTMEDRPFPGCLILGFICSNPVHAVIAIDRIFLYTFIKEVGR